MRILTVMMASFPKLTNETMEETNIIRAFIESNQTTLLWLIFTPLVLRLLLNSYLINKRDNTNKFIFFLSPFSQSNWNHSLEAAFRLWWPKQDVNSRLRTYTNVVNIVFLLVVVSAIVSVILENVLY